MPDRTLAPSFQKTLVLSLPAATEIALSNGVKIFHLEGLKQRIVKIEVIFNAGKWEESKNGVSHFTSMMLEKGTTSRPSALIASTLDRYGASLEISPGFDYVSVSLYSLKEKLHEVFPLFIEILREPAFYENEWFQMLDIFLQNLKINNEKTSFVASKIIRKNVFGEAHPYGSAVEEADAGRLSTADLIQFFRSSFRVHSAYLLGDLSSSEVSYLQDGISSLPVGEGSGIVMESAQAVPFAWQSNKEGRLQSTIRMGKRSVLKTDPEYADVLMATHLLGGFFGSRLMKNIREDKGLTYGISSSLNTFRHDSLFMIGADVNKENVSLALTEIRKELRKLMDSLVSEQELSLARNHFTGSLQTDMANLFSVEEKLKNIHLNGLPSDYYQQLLLRVDAITPQRILDVARRHFNPESLFEVVVG